jgi:putative membrane protein
MKEPVQKFLSQQELQAVEERVTEAEKTTSGEIVVMAVSSSHHYSHASLTGSLLTSLVLAVLVSWLFGKENLWVFLGCFGVTFIALNELISRNHRLKRLFMNASDMGREVEDAAHSAFIRRKVHETREHTGILIYISLLERKVRVIADSGISAKVEEREWKAIVDMIVAGIREERQGAAICGAVDRCGEILHRHFPKLQDDRNELGDTMIIGS